MGGGVAAAIAVDDEGVLGGETLEHQEGQGTGLKFFGVTYDLSVLSVTKSE